MSAPRGQATVELALGALVFVTVILFGIHFAEVGWLSLKVQEAQSFAVWETTGRRVQQREASGAVSTGNLNQTLSATGVSDDAQRRYRDFEGVGGTGGAVISRALTRGSGMRVACLREPGLEGVPAAVPSATPRAAGVLSAAGGLECRAEADLAALNLPRSFLEGGSGFFQAAHSRSTPIHVCGMGRATGGACRGHLAVLTNDWGLMGPAESGECRVRGACANPLYKAAVGAMFGGGGSAGADFAMQFAGAAPATANEFHFSFRGAPEALSMEPVGGEGAGTYNTGGPGIGMVPQRFTGAPCFLGKPGC